MAGSGRFAALREKSRRRFRGYPVATVAYYGLDTTKATKVAVAVILRWVPVVRERRLPWFGAHQAAVAAIVAGHALLGSTGAVIVNSAWFVVAAAWYAAGGAFSRRRRP